MFDFFIGLFLGFTIPYSLEYIYKNFILKYKCYDCNKKIIGYNVTNGTCKKCVKTI
jgi:hypothetical protein